MDFENLILFLDNNLSHFIFAAVVLIIAFIIVKILRFSINRFIINSSKQFMVLCL